MPNSPVASVVGLSLLLSSAALPAQSLHAPGAVPPIATSPVANMVFDPSQVIALGADRAERMTVPVRLAGEGPFDFVIDTGSERTVLSRQLAERLGLAPGRPAVIHGVAGSTTVSTARLPSVAIDRQQLNLSEAPLLERQHLGADGLLGIDSLASRQVLFDFGRNEMTVHPSRARVLTASDGAIVVRARSRKGRLIFTRATLDGIRVAVIVDSGSQYTVGNPALLARLGQRKAALDPHNATLISVTGAEATARIGTVGTLDLGTIELRAFGMAFADADIFRTLDLAGEPALLLGMNAMRSFDRVLVDFANRKVSFVLAPRSQVDSRSFATIAGNGGPRIGRN